MLNRSLKFMLMFTLLAGLGACAINTAPRVDDQMGDSLRMMRAQQTLKPEASLNRDPVTGVDGKAAQGAQGRYHESFRQPPTENALTSGTGIGGGSSR